MSDHKHSEIPWKFYLKQKSIGDTSGQGVCAMWSEGNELEANAAFIVTACNAHYELVYAAKEMAILLRALTGPDDEVAQLIIGLSDEALKKAGAS